MLLATKTAIDEPKVVVEEIIKAIEADKQEYYIGQPESFFAWLNGFLPSLVAMGLKNQPESLVNLSPQRIKNVFVTKEKIYEKHDVVAKFHCTIKPSIC